MTVINSKLYKICKKKSPQTHKNDASEIEKLLKNSPPCKCGRSPKTEEQNTTLHAKSPQKPTKLRRPLLKPLHKLWMTTSSLRKIFNFLKRKVNHQYSYRINKSIGNWSSFLIRTRLSQLRRFAWLFVLDLLLTVLYVRQSAEYMTLKYSHALHQFKFIGRLFCNVQWLNRLFNVFFFVFLSNLCMILLRQPTVCLSDIGAIFYPISCFAEIRSAFIRDGLLKSCW